MNLEQIDTSTTAGKAEVMRLAAEGRRVAWRQKKVAQWWESKIEPVWDWTSASYAIIAEPVGPEELWVLQRHGDPICVYPEEKDGTIRYIRADLAGEKG